KYEIILMKRPANEKDTLQKSINYNAYALKVAFEQSVYDLTDGGFGELAQAMLTWLVADATGDVNTGIDYIQENYPALVETINGVSGIENVDTDNDVQSRLESALKDRMSQLFADSYKKTTTGLYGYDDSNRLSSDAKETLYFLIWNNLYQGAFNAAINVLNDQ